MNTKDNNLELILTFLGIEFLDYKGRRISNGHKEATTVGQIKDFFGKEVMTSGQFIEDIDWWNFQTDWNDLMFLVQKINELGYEVLIGRISCQINPILYRDNPISSMVCGDISKKIEITYEAIIRFINWFNQN